MTALTPTRDTIRERAARGARMLDEREPGWFKHVDVDRLDMLSATDDLLAQTWDGPVASWSSPSEAHYDVLFPDLVEEKASRYGLGGKSRRELWALGEEWKRVILARREGSAQ